MPRSLALLIAVCSLLFAGAVSAETLVPTLSHGPTLAMYSLTQDEGVFHGEMLTAGAGWEVSVNMVDSEFFPWISLSMPHVVGAKTATDAFAYATGLTIKFAGNLGFGALVDLVRTENGEGSGLLTGKFDAKRGNLQLVFMVSVPFSEYGGVVTAGR